MKTGANNVLLHVKIKTAIYKGDGYLSHSCPVLSPPCISYVFSIVSIPKSDLQRLVCISLSLHVRVAFDVVK